MTRKIRLSRPVAGAAWMAGAGAIFALINLAVQGATMALGQGAPAVAFWQYFIALLIVLPFVAGQIRGALRGRYLGWHLVRVGMAAGGVQLWVMGLAHVPIWQAIALVMTAPFFVTAGAGLFLGERLSVARCGAVAVGFVGGMVILAPWSDEFGTAILLPLGAAVLWAGSSLITKRMTGQETPEALTLWLLLLLTPVNGAIALGDGFALSGDAIWLVGIAGILTAAAQYALVRAYAVADAAYLQPFDHLKLPMNVALGWAVFGFLPAGTMWIGALLILGASLWLVRSETMVPAPA